MSISGRIYEARKNKGLHQEEVSRLTGIHQNTLSNWERGLSTPKAESILKLCKCYDVSPNYLLDYDDTANEMSDMFKTMLEEGDFDFLIAAMAWEPEQRSDLNSLIKLLEQAPPEVMDGLNGFLSSLGFSSNKDKKKRRFGRRKTDR